MNRLVIHAGFAKSGSSSIQTALGQHLKEMEAAGIYFVGTGMEIGKAGVHPGLALWYLERVAAAETADGCLADLLQAAPVPDGSTLVLTSENLSMTKMPRLFAGIDRTMQTEVVFYMRPQTEFIPSAWKQWGSKLGLSLEAFIAHCIRMHRPANGAEIACWAETLPKARIIVRPFLREVMEEGDPVVDFMRILGFAGLDPAKRAAPANASFDYSLLHLLSILGNRRFSGIHDNEFSDMLVQQLPPQWLRTNLPMLSPEAEARIEARFRPDNLSILQHYCGWSAADYAHHYRLKATSENYMDQPEAEVLQRAHDILAPTFGEAWAAEAVKTATAASA